MLVEGSPASPELLESPWTAENFPELPLEDFPGTPLTVGFRSNPFQCGLVTRSCQGKTANVTMETLLNSQKNPFSVRKIVVRNSGARNGCVNFMDAWKNAFFLQEKPMSLKFLVLGGGYLGFLGGGADFIFMGARIFLMHNKNTGSKTNKAMGVTMRRQRHSPPRPVNAKLIHLATNHTLAGYLWPLQHRP